MALSSSDLLSNASATGAWFSWVGGRGFFTAEGTFSGATVALEFKGPNGTAISAGSTTAFTANGGAVFELPSGDIRASVASGTPSGLYAKAITI